MGIAENRRNESEAPFLEMNSPLVFCKGDKQLAYYGDALRKDYFSERLIRVRVTFWSKMHKWPNRYSYMKR